MGALRLSVAGAADSTGAVEADFFTFGFSVFLVADLDADLTPPRLALSRVPDEERLALVRLVEARVLTSLMSSEEFSMSLNCNTCP